MVARRSSVPGKRWSTARFPTHVAKPYRVVHWPTVTLHKRTTYVRHESAWLLQDCVPH
jgi:hypothetical protein